MGAEQTDTMKLIVALSNIANAPKNIAKLLCLIRILDAVFSDVTPSNLADIHQCYGATFCIPIYSKCYQNPKFGKYSLLKFFKKNFEIINEESFSLRVTCKGIKFSDTIFH